MCDHTFGEAYARVRKRFSDQYWFSLSPREITNAIYGEIRAMDLERSRAAQEANEISFSMAAE